MSFTHRQTNQSLASQPELDDPFALQLALSRVHVRLVPMRRGVTGYEIDPSAQTWGQLLAPRGLAGYGLPCAMRMLIDVLRGLAALHETPSPTGERFVHGEVATAHFRVDPLGVCRLVPLTVEHSAKANNTEPKTAGQLTPERLLGKKIDARSDGFRAGILLWEALTGRRMSEPATAAAIVNRSIGEILPMPPLPPELAWALPLHSVATCALAVDPQQRFSDCTELATAIAVVAREHLASHAEVANSVGMPTRFERHAPKSGERSRTRGAPSDDMLDAWLDSSLAPTSHTVSQTSPESELRPASRKSPFLTLLMPPPPRSSSGRAGPGAEGAPLQPSESPATTAPAMKLSDRDTLRSASMPELTAVESTRAPRSALVSPPQRPRLKASSPELTGPPSVRPRRE